MEKMKTSTHCPLSEPYIETKLLVYLKYCTLYKKRKASKSKFLPCYVRYRPLKRVLKSTTNSNLMHCVDTSMFNTKI